jgi:glucans biosynthesis protein C
VRHAYAVYIVHIPVITCVALALRAVHLPGILMFPIGVLITLPLCFAVASLARRLPMASRVL